LFWKIGGKCGKENYRQNRAAAPWPKGRRDLPFFFWRFRKFLLLLTELMKEEIPPFPPPPANGLPYIWKAYWISNIQLSYFISFIFFYFFKTLSTHLDIYHNGSHGEAGLAAEEEEEKDFPPSKHPPPPPFIRRRKILHILLDNHPQLGYTRGN
jgi:hypothetical protein